MYARRIVSVLLAALAVGVCAFITFISRDVDNTTLMFNLAFLGIMLLAIGAAWIAGFGRLLQDCKALQHGIDEIRKGPNPAQIAGKSEAPLFENEFLDECYQQYCRMLKSKPEAPCDIRSFINEETIETHARRGLLEMIPDILTSLGILGTFVGLVMGLRSFDPSSYEQMADSITPLINGIKVAFITSIYGISLSLAFSFQLRSEFSNLTSLMEEFLDLFYVNVRPPYEVDSLSRLLDGQKSREEMTKDLTTLFVEQMGKSFEQVITPAYERMTDGINHVVTSFTESQTQVMTQVCEAVVTQMRTELAEEFSALQKTVSDLQKAQTVYADYMDRSMARMQQTFDSMQESMKQMTQYSSDALAQIADSQNEALRINHEQEKSYQEYIRFMYQSISQFSDIWEQNSQRMQAYSDEIAKMGPVQSNLEIRSDLANLSKQLQEMQKIQMQTVRTMQDSSDDQEVLNLLDETLRKLDKLEDLVDVPVPFLFRRRKK